MSEKMMSATLEDVRIAFRNFSGKEGKYNREGDRNFCILLPDDISKQMEQDGWNVRYLNPREAEDLPQGYLQVAVSYKGRPPRVVMVTSRSKTSLDEDMVSILDWAEVIKADVIIRPYEWAVNGKSGVKAYLQSIYVTIEEDELERKYGDVPDSAASSISTDVEQPNWYND
jgi:hypothetical protein